MKTTGELQYGIFLVDVWKNYKTFFGTGIFTARYRRTSRI
jgi:hypothetical protein